MSDPFDLSRGEFAARELAHPAGAPRPRRGEPFLKGPVPCLWRIAGCRKSAGVPLNLSNLPMDAQAARRGLAALASAGLVAVEHRPGRPSLVTLLPAPENDPR